MEIDGNKGRSCDAEGERLMLDLTLNTPTLQDTIRVMTELVRIEEARIVGQAFTLWDPSEEGARFPDSPQCSATREDPHPGPGFTPWRVERSSQSSNSKHHLLRLQGTVVVQNQPPSIMCYSHGIGEKKIFIALDPDYKTEVPVNTLPWRFMRQSPKHAK